MKEEYDQQRCGWLACLFVSSTVMQTANWYDFSCRGNYFSGT